MEQRFTRSEVERMTGASRKQLEYWSRLRLIQPRSRWGERFFNFSDLVAVEALKRLTAEKVSAQRLSRVVQALEQKLGATAASLSSLHISVAGDQVVVRAPGRERPPIEPLTGQFVMDFETAPLQRKVHSLGPRTAEEWFERAMSLDTETETMEQAVDAYRRAIQSAPDWIDAQINLGTALFHLGRLEESRKAFAIAVKIDPHHALAHFNLACLSDKLDDLEGAAQEFRAALACAPEMAEAHLNLALVYEKLHRKSEAKLCLASYLRYDPQGRWAEYARKRLGAGSRARRASTKAAKVTPFRRARN